MSKPIEDNKRFVKIYGERKDNHPVGAFGTILRRIGPMPEGEPFAGEYGYFVRFDGDDVETFIRGAKIEECR